MVAADSGRSRRAAAKKIPLRTTQAPGNQSMMRLMAFLLLGLLAGQAAAAGLFARVARTQLSIDETLGLSLASQGSTVFGKPDLQQLGIALLRESVGKYGEILEVDETVK